MLPPTRTLYFEDLSIGLTESYEKEVKPSDVVGFAEITGDRNPIHLSEHFAAKTPFGGRIDQAPLLRHEPQDFRMATMPEELGADLDQLLLETRQRPIHDRLE